MMSEAVLVVGVCDLERHRYAHSLASLRRLPVRFEPGGPRHGHTRRPWSAADAVVVEAAADVDIAHLLSIGPAPTVVCVVDAVHMIDDLCSTVALLDHAPPGDDRGDVGARARQAASLIEAASIVALVNWQSVDTPRLSILMALASHLSPTALIRLSRDPHDDLRSAPVCPQPRAWQDRAGWLRALNSEHDPYMTDRRVMTFRYEQMRPFHPARLAHVLEDGLQPDRVGLILRSVGFCRLSTRTAALARWEQAGSAMWIDAVEADEQMLSVVQEIAFTGLDLHHHRIRAALDGAALTDDELLAGPAAWARFDDPLPTWPIVTDDADRTDG